mmetsp:Transcript_8128/g.16905  ORF Transcript_8128/g.16905 Transcript_8128/m.16905 type:complete len:215 (+) Transcript_8128:449-1093(+)
MGWTSLWLPKEWEGEADRYEHALKYSWDVMTAAAAEGGDEVRQVDKEVGASGHSKQDAQRDMELYYFENGRNEAWSQKAKQDEEEEEEGEANGSEEDEDEDEDGEPVHGDEGTSECLEQIKLTGESGDPSPEGEDGTDSDDGSLPPPPLSIYDMDREELKTALYAEAQARAQEHVRKNRGGRGRKGGSGPVPGSGSRNSNKCYIKGRRVVREMM